jgi:hypothetical protein
LRLMRRAFAAALLFVTLAASPLHGGSYDRVTIDTVKTSIYIGNVTLTTSPFVRNGTRYHSDYRAKVFPYFFHNEKGVLWVELTDDKLAALDRGERVHFTGHAENSDKESRRIEGHATPTAPGSRTGKIKVRVWVSPKIELIFNSTYRFE